MRKKPGYPNEFCTEYLQFIRFKFFVGVGHESTHLFSEDHNLLTTRHVFNNFGRSDGDMIK